MKLKRRGKGTAADLGPDLPHRVAVPQSSRVRRLIHCVKVDRDAKRHSDLIRPGVAPSDGA